MSQKLYTEKEVQAMLKEKDDLIAELEKLAMFDPLTGLYNRNFVNAEIGRLTALKRRESVDFGDKLKPQYICVSFIDLIKMKTINDTHGHAAGDMALSKVAEILRDTARKSDIPARIGGDEFVTITVADNSRSCDSFAERLQSRLASLEFDLEGKKVMFGATVGYKTEVLTPEFSFEKLLKEADMEMYARKQSA
ncbi:MAG: hypothetical protein UX75_C0047G0005 [Candidatus Moranbacteria bacterium GW2011_GWE2_47_10]|nr:MAG: hypothetical protein UX75_C0047G0005 [Candidatus Moranbacteria bacterium GW2011_GWE2_47_10]